MVKRGMAKKRGSSVEGSRLKKGSYLDLKEAVGSKPRVTSRNPNVFQSTGGAGRAGGQKSGLEPEAQKAKEMRMNAKVPKWQKTKDKKRDKKRPSSNFDLK